MIGRILGWIPRGIAFVVALIPLLIVGGFVAGLILMLYVTTPLIILTSWLTFVAEGKWTKWFSRAWHDMLSSHMAVKGIVNGLF